MSESGLTVQQELPIASAPDGKTPSPQAPRKFVIPDDAKLDGTTAAPAAAASDPQTAQNTGEQAPPATSDGEPEKPLTPEEQAERDRKREGRRVERKISQAYRKAAEAQARAEFAERQLSEQRAAQAPQPVAAEGKPTLAQFDYDPDKYAAAVETWTREQTLKELHQQSVAQRSTQFQESLRANWEEQVEKASDEHEDFGEVVGNLTPNSPLTVGIMKAGAAVAYNLGKNPKEAQRIASLPPIEQLIEIGVLKAKLAAEPTKPKTPSKAPAPVTPLTASSPVSSAAPSENDDMRTWMNKRNKQIAARR